MIEKQIDLDYIQAMKAKDTLRSSTLNFLRAQLKNIRIEKKVNALEDSDVIAAIKKQSKQRQDSIEQYRKGGRQDLVDKETRELEILKTYLPQEMPDEELQVIVTDSIKEAEAQSIKDMGKVMKLVMPKVSGRADNRKVSEFVKKALTS